jgi:hypothetical protein
MTQKQKLVSGSYQETETKVNSPPPVAKPPTQNPGCSMPLPRMVLLFLQKIPFSNFPKFYSPSSSVSAPTNNNKHQNDLHFYGLGFRVSHKKTQLFCSIFQALFPSSKASQEFQTLLLESQPEGRERFLHERQGILKSKYDPWKNNAGVFILILLSYPLGIAEK